MLSFQPGRSGGKSEFLRFQVPVQHENLQRFILFRHTSGMLSRIKLDLSSYSTGLRRIILLDILSLKYLRLATA